MASSRLLITPPSTFFLKLRPPLKSDAILALNEFDCLPDV